MRGVRDAWDKFPPLYALREDVVLACVPHGGGASVSAKTFANELGFKGEKCGRLVSLGLGCPWDV